MRRVTGYVTGFQWREWKAESGEWVKRVTVHWFGNPLEGEGETGFEVRTDSLDAGSVAPGVVLNGTPVKASLMIEDRDVYADVYGKRMRVKVPRLRSVEVWKG